jgi:predicted RNA-binding protein
MCLAKVYDEPKEDEPALEDVAYLTVDGDRIEVETLFGERRAFQGRVRHIDFMKSRVELSKD